MRWLNRLGAAYFLGTLAGHVLHIVNERKNHAIWQAEQLARFDERDQREREPHEDEHDPAARQGLDPRSDRGRPGPV